MTEAQIKHMVDRFLNWRLPQNFNPDAGISFKSTFNEHTPHPMKHEPTGTNLFDASQADAMVRYMLEGLTDHENERLRDILRGINHTLIVHGHVDRWTPLHHRIVKALSSVSQAKCNDVENVDASQPFRGPDLASKIEQ